MPVLPCVLVEETLAFYEALGFEATYKQRKPYVYLALRWSGRDEPDELEYGGSKKLTGLARALDNARILREFKNDDRQAFRALKSAVRRHGANAPAVERGLALCHLIDLATVLGEPAEPWIADLRALELTAGDRQRIESELGLLAGLREWLS
ncbi:hypothetical protein GCM10022224_058370 [Nonomuraea antimicrobica]|uniref:Uncharacterized protein n=1 Tax=Nonomuraea antimicrobica TaxID=561173 RepID=A0ABP7CB08_9ACTN